MNIYRTLIDIALVISICVSAVRHAVAGNDFEFEVLFVLAIIFAEVALLRLDIILNNLGNKHDT